MSLTSELNKKIEADRKAGRDISPVIEELILMIAEKVDKSKVENHPATKTSK
ncbi:hypothetical protein [Rhizobium ruizarguesonis]|uniref:hypothetical protein n=1 Tax=Rhizobium ruizarguesonis TaxID=2081791 RepID=UPI001444BDDC|nr:hypothetical protein [Rhizobium ruizarguesonis]